MMHVSPRLDDFLAAINLTFSTGDTIVMAGVATAWLVVVVSTCPCGLEVVRSVVVFMVSVISATALLICHVGGNTMSVGAAAAKSCSLKTCWLIGHMPVFVKPFTAVTIIAARIYPPRKSSAAW